MGRDPVLRDCTDAAVLRDFLGAELNRQARDRFGAELSLPLLIQVESARQRLGKLADLQARERAAGWVIQAVEQPFTVEIAGLTVRGKIDRIDRHETSGAVRVVDYKTSDTAVTPRSAHVRPVRAGETLPDWMLVTIDGKTRAWVDLQLPLYREALTPQWGANIACGYINLPKAIGQTALALWEDYTPELHAAAMRCATGVCTAIRAGEFWPPNEDLPADSDDFAALFHRGVAASVKWEAANA
jgi:ATP-dependent helicase/nuclease subunit B